MTLSGLKTTGVFFILFFLDLFRPFGYYLNIEFLFLGVIFLCLSKKFKLAFFLSFFFGGLKDFVISYPDSRILSLFEYPALCLVAYYFLSYSFFADKRKYALIFRNLLALILISLHAIINSIVIESGSLSFFFAFVAQSFIAFFAVDYLFTENEANI